MFLCLIKFISKYSEGQGRPWPGPALMKEGQGQGQQNQARAGPDRPVDSLARHILNLNGPAHEEQRQAL